MSRTTSTMDENDYFWRVVNTPGWWQDAARDLICAANLLKKDYYASPRLGFPRRGTMPPYARLRQRYTSSRAIIVLYALAVENMLKAIIVAKSHDPIDKKGRLSRWFATHDLEKLALHAGVHGLKQTALDQLAAFSMSGKYPVGREDGERARAHGYFPDTVLLSVEKILARLERHLGAIKCDRDKRPPIDLLSLCAAGRRKKAVAGSGAPTTGLAAPRPRRRQR